MSTLTYEYRAVDAGGGKRTGTLQGKTEQEIYRQLTSMGLTPLTIRAAAGKVRGHKVKLRQLAQFTGQLSVLVSARISISEGLYSIGEQETEPGLKAVIQDLSSRVAAGETIADSLTHHPRVFDEIYIETVRSAERSGTLPKALEFLATMLERTEETRRQIKGALMYPLCVICALSLGVAFLLAYVVPKFANMFASRGVELPIFTKILQGFGMSMQDYWWAYLGLIVGSVFCIRAAWKNKTGRQVIDRLLHKVPYIRSILIGLALQRFSQVLGVSIQSGLGLIESLELAGRSAGRPMLNADIEILAKQVRTGGRLSECLPKCAYLTPFTKRMMMAGENSAELPRMCQVISRHYEREASHLTKNISTVIEPVLVVLIAGVVMMVALAIFLPMWNMVQLMG
jgi:type II secretory pathway component PulF